MVPLISVILPVFNAEKYILNSIDSILNQTTDDFELIIINDGSTDNSKEIILSRKDKRIIYVENRYNQGLVRSLNRGLFLSRGKFIARMDADDNCNKARFETQISYLLKNKKVDILGTQQYIIGSSKKILHCLSNDESKVLLLAGPSVAHSAVMIKKQSLISNHLYYDKNALLAEDYKLWVDSSLSGLIIENVDKVLCGYRFHEMQISSLQWEKQQITTNQIRFGYANFFFLN